MILRGNSPSDVGAATRMVARILKEYPDRDIISTGFLEDRIRERSPGWYAGRTSTHQTNILRNAMERNGWVPWNHPQRNYRITAWVRPKRTRKPMMAIPRG